MYVGCITLTDVQIVRNLKIKKKISLQLKFVSILIDISSDRVYFNMSIKMINDIFVKIKLQA